MKKRNRKRMRDLVERKRSMTHKPFHLVTGWKRTVLVLFALVLAKRVKVANQLYSLSDTMLLAAGQRFADNINTNAYFSTPPSLAALVTLLGEFSTLITLAASRDNEQVALKNAKREELMNMLCTFGNYVEDIANDVANAAVGPVAVIESAGMRARAFTPRGKQVWDVFRGFFSGSLDLTAANIRRGSHDWQYTLTPTDETSWISVPSTLKARTTITGLTPGSFVYCRHRTVTKLGQSDWEGHDPVIVV